MAVRARGTALRVLARACTRGAAAAASTRVRISGPRIPMRLPTCVLHAGHLSTVPVCTAGGHMHARYARPRAMSHVWCRRIVLLSPFVHSAPTRPCCPARLLAPAARQAAPQPQPQALPLTWVERTRPRKFGRVLDGEIATCRAVRPLFTFLCSSQLSVPRSRSICASCVCLQPTAV